MNTPQEQKKWLMEYQIDSDGDEVWRILRLGSDGVLELCYITGTEELAKTLITALEWFESFSGGTIKKAEIPSAPMVLELTLEEPKRRPGRPKKS